jgi:D-alanyl-lipoteichoic acid acyltransferase DltB (MBOAT superfamily)
LPFFYKYDFYGPFSDALFANADTVDPLQLWFFVYLFMARITLFISAMSDGVIGMNLMMGIRAPENSSSHVRVLARSSR